MADHRAMLGLHVHICVVAFVDKIPNINIFAMSSHELSV